MDQILVAENNLIEEECNSKSISCVNTEDNLFDCLSATVAKDEQSDVDNISRVGSNNFSLDLKESNNTSDKKLSRFNSKENIRGNDVNAVNESNIPMNSKCTSHGVVAVNKFDCSIKFLNEQDKLKHSERNETETSIEQSASSIKLNTCENTSELCDQKSSKDVTTLLINNLRPKCTLFSNINEVKFFETVDESFPRNDNVPGNTEDNNYTSVDMSNIIHPASTSNIDLLSNNVIIENDTNENTDTDNSHIIQQVYSLTGIKNNSKNLPLSFGNTSVASESVKQNVSEIKQTETVLNNDKNNEFIPTIVDIRGACTDVLDGTLVDNVSTLIPNFPKFSGTVSAATGFSCEKSELSHINIVNVQGSFKELNLNNRENEKCSEEVNGQNVNSGIIYTIDDDDSVLPENQSEDFSFNTDVTIKLEPLDNVTDDDCTYINTERSNACFTSEIFIKEEKPSSGNAKLEVYCIETSSKIPSPIPIKTEANVENEEQSISSDLNVRTSQTELPKTVPTKTDDYVTLSSGSEREDSSDSKERNKILKSPMYSTVGYTCHLCNTTFQEHELLNEHMILHRNNSLIETKVQNKNKPKPKIFACKTCNKRLSTWQSLQQHTMIHNNEKPHVCSICNKDFRHLSNFKMHLQQKHSEQRPCFKEQETLKDKERLDKSVVRAVDFGRLVGPLFMKETLLNQKNKTVDVKKVIQSKTVLLNKNILQPRFSFDKPIIKVKDNAKEKKIAFKKNIDIKEKTNEDVEDEIIPLKTFNNVENIVMNAARFIVKLDNLDPNQLKRKIKTPDISIDKPVDKKRRIVLSSSSKNQKVKLDQIENIIMDVFPSDDCSSEQQPSVSSETRYYSLSMSDEDDMHHIDDHIAIDEVVNKKEEKMKKLEKWDTAKANSLNKESLHGTLTDNELFELLNDGRDVRDESPQRDYVSELRNNAQRIFKQESESAKNFKFDFKITVKPCNRATETSPSLKQKSSNVVLLPGDSPLPNSTIKRMHPKVSAEYSFLPAAKKTKNAHTKQQAYSNISSNSDRLSETNEDSSMGQRDIEMDWEKYDDFDTAFHKVAIRRLQLMKKRAALNDGKLESRYLLGPLFWRKALRRVEQNQVETDLVVSKIISKSLLPRRFGNRIGKLDERRTNDPTKLQVRAENKLKCILDKVRMMSDLSNLDLIGPLFWKKTLKLAGIRNPDDLKTLLDEDLLLSLTDVQFVENELSQSDKNSSSDRVIDADLKKLVLDTPKSADSKNDTENRNTYLNVDSNKKNALMDGILNDELLKSGQKNCQNKFSKSGIEVDDKSNTVEQINSSAGKCTSITVFKNNISNSKNNVKTDSILYDSLTKPRDRSLGSQGDTLKVKLKNLLINEKRYENEKIIIKENDKNNENVNLKSNDKKTKDNDLIVDTFGLTIKGENETEQSRNCNVEHSKKQDSKLSTRLTERYKMDVNRITTDSTFGMSNEEGSDIAMGTGVDGSNIILNVDGGFHLLAPDGEKPVDSPNYVLVSDETGAMQYVVNVPGENYGNFELISDANGEQLTYAIQFDGENYTAVQLLQDNTELENVKNEKQDLKEDKINAVAVSPRHIGKELSDFLNLDYGTLMKEKNHDQGTT